MRWELRAGDLRNATIVMVMMIVDVSTKRGIFLVFTDESASATQRQALLLFEVRVGTEIIRKSPRLCELPTCSLPIVSRPAIFLRPVGDVAHHSSGPE